MKRFCALVLLLMPLVATAASDLGAVRVPVPDRGADTRRDALARGLERVLVRLTGDPRPASLSALRPLLQGDPSNWVVQYSYEEQATDEEARDQDPEAMPLELVAAFDVSGLIKRLMTLEAPVWDETRPEVLFWLVEQGPVRGELLGRDGEGAATQALRRAARARGLPLVLPALDREDRRSVQAADIRGRFDEPVAEASARYQASLVVTAVFYKGDTPRVRWRLLDEGSERTGGELEADTGEQVLAALVDRVTDYLVDLYAVRGGPQSSVVTLRIRELDRLQDWNALRGYLAGLAGMRSLRLTRLDGDAATFSAHFSGDLEHLARLAKLKKGLEDCERHDALSVSLVEPEDQAPAPGADDARRELELCWRGDH